MNLLRPRLFLFLTAALMLLLACGGEAQTEPVPTPTATQILATSTSTQISPTPTAKANPTPIPTSVEPVDNVKVPALKIFNALGNVPAYDRGDWRHWIDVDGDCQNARHEVLVEESAIPVTFTDARECSVSGGQWVGLFTGVTVLAASKLDVDHMVPLANAHRSGGWAWDSEKKKEYANNLSYSGHLIAVTASANRSKGAKGPEDWRPPDSSYWCNYATDWINIKATWELTATNAEWAALTEMLDTCSDKVAVGEAVSSISTMSTVEPSPTPTVIKVVSETPKVVVEAQCVDLNIASKEELQRIVHIGASRAEAVIKMRPLKSVAALDDVFGISASRLSDIVAQNLACV